MSNFNRATRLFTKPVVAWAVAFAMSASLGLAQHSSEHDRAGGAHQDHEPKHGGVFFMAMNYHNHVEGVLEPPGVFRVYVYDDHTLPLAKDKIKQVSGRLFLGESDEAPEIPLELSRDGLTLEATLPAGTNVPVTLTLLMRFPGMKADARPELFTFPFDEFSKTDRTSRTGSHAMEGM
jgi:hypothetical protein